MEKNSVKAIWFFLISEINKDKEVKLYALCILSFASVTNFTLPQLQVLLQIPQPNHVSYRGRDTMVIWSLFPTPYRYWVISSLYVGHYF